VTDRKTVQTVLNGGQGADPTPGGGGSMRPLPNYFGLLLLLM